MPKVNKKAKQAKVAKVMGEYKRGTLRSGSKKGPKVKKRAQAQAIAMSESGQSKSPGERAKRKKRLEGMEL